MKHGKYRCNDCGHRLFATVDGDVCFNCRDRFVDLRELV